MNNRIESTGTTLYITSMSAILDGLDSIIAEICELQNRMSEDHIRTYQAQIRMRETPFEEKTAFLEKELDNLYSDNPNIPLGKIEDIKAEIGHIADQYMNYLDGIKELHKYIDKMQFDDAHTRQLKDILSRSITEFSDSVITTGIRPEAFVKLRAALSAYNFPEDDISFGKATDGTYFAIYTAQVKPLFMDMIRQTLYSLGQSSRPTEEEINSFARNAFDISDANVTRIKGISPEMAEIMIQNGSFKSNVSFAKELTQQDAPTSVICRTGEKSSNEQRFFTACKMLLDSAINLSGEKGREETKRLHKNIKNNEKIQDMIQRVSLPGAKDEEGGKIVFIRAHHEKEDENGNALWSENTDIPYLDEVIDITPERYVKMDHAVEYDEAYANIEGSGYAHSLNTVIYSGDPDIERRFFSYEEVKQLEASIQKISNINDSLPEPKLKSALQEYADTLEKCENPKDRSAEAEAAREKIQQLEVIIAAYREKEFNAKATQTIQTDVTIDDLKNSAFACAAYRSRTKAYVLTNSIKSEMAFKSFADQRLKDMSYNISLYDSKTAVRTIQSCMKQMNLQEFLYNEQQRVANGDLSQKMYEFEEKYFSGGKFEELKSEVVGKLDNISIEIENVALHNPLLDRSEIIGAANKRLDEFEKRINDKYKGFSNRSLERSEPVHRSGRDERNFDEFTR